MKIGVYHGCHNTFVVTMFEDNVNYSEMAINLCNKYNTDGFLILKKDPLEMLFYNADGSRAPMCGNGIRCFARFAYDLGYKIDDWTDVVTLGGLMKIKITSYDPFTVITSLGKPNFSSSKLDINTSLYNFINQNILVHNNTYQVSCVFLGTHHAVIFVDDFDNLPGKLICEHKLFKSQINVNFVKIINRNKIFVKTYERGVGWTKACGTGASSSYVISKLMGFVDNEITVDFIGGSVKLSSIEDIIFMEGPAEIIMEVTDEE